jgi:hypothetical protein
VTGARLSALARLRATSGRAATAFATRLRSGFHPFASLSRKAMSEAVLIKVFPASFTASISPVGEQTVCPAPAVAEDRRGVVDCLKRFVPPGNAACLGIFRHSAARKVRRDRDKRILCGFGFNDGAHRPNLARTEAVRNASSAPVRRSAISIEVPGGCPGGLGRVGEP